MPEPGDETGPPPPRPASPTENRLLGVRGLRVDDENNVLLNPRFGQIIDSLSREWWFKPVGFVSYGGISGGLRAVEHLRGVFAELNAVAIRDCVSFANASDQFDAQGCPVDPEAASRAMARMLAGLGWWARALRAARRAEQCSGVAA